MFQTLALQPLLSCVAVLGFGLGRRMVVFPFADGMSEALPNAIGFTHVALHLTVSTHVLEELVLLV